MLYHSSYHETHRLKYTQLQIYKLPCVHVKHSLSHYGKKMYYIFVKTDNAENPSMVTGSKWQYLLTNMNSLQQERDMNNT
jgi:hypothetical protein